MINMAIIGIGQMGMNHADIITKNKDLNLIAVSKKSLERLKEIKDKYDVEVYTDNDKLLDIRDIDYIVITTTNDTHEELTIKALSKGKNVIVEKPMSLNYESSLKMINAAKKYKKNLFVYQSRRWDRDFLLVRDIIKSKKLGKILTIEAKIVDFGKDWVCFGIHGTDFQWLSKKQYGGGMLNDWGPHLVDHMLQIMGKEPEGLFGILQSGTWCSEVDDQFLAIMKFDNDIIYQIEAFSSCRIPPARWLVVGTKGTLKIKGKNTSIWDEAEINYIKDDGSNEIQTIKMVDFPESMLSPGFYNDFVRFLKGEIKDFVTMYEGSNIIKILDLIRISSKEKKYISL